MHVRLSEERRWCRASTRLTSLVAAEAGQLTSGNREHSGMYNNCNRGKIGSSLIRIGLSYSMTRAKNRIASQIISIGILEIKKCLIPIGWEISRFLSIQKIKGLGCFKVQSSDCWIFELLCSDGFNNCSYIVLITVCRWGYITVCRWGYITVCRWGYITVLRWFQLQRLYCFNNSVQVGLYLTAQLV